MLWFSNPVFGAIGRAGSGRVSKLHLLEYRDGIKKSHLSLNDRTSYRTSVNKKTDRGVSVCHSPSFSLTHAGKWDRCTAGFCLNNLGNILQKV